MNKVGIALKDLKIHLNICVFNINTGNEVILKGNDFIKALLASYPLPLVYNSVVHKFEKNKILN